MNVNSEEFELYLNDKTLVDMDQMCEQFFGAEFILKSKNYFNFYLINLKN